MKEDKYVLGQNPDTKDWFVYDDETNQYVCIDTKENCIKYIQEHNGIVHDPWENELTNEDICENAISVIEGLLYVIKTKIENWEEERIIQDAENAIEDLKELEGKLE